MEEKIILNKTTKQLKQERANALVVKIARHKQFKGKCNDCGTVWHRRGMLFHHIRYRKGEKSYKDFKGDKLAYYIYLQPIILAYPKEFEYLCTPCHIYVGKLRRIKDNKRIRNLANTAIRTEYVPPKGRSKKR